MTRPGGGGAPVDPTGADDGFGRLARGYEALERLAFGGALQRARLRHLDALLRPEVRRVLIVGEGDGRFLAALLRRVGDRVGRGPLEVVCVDSSPGMTERARARAERSAPGPDRVEVAFVEADVRALALAEASFDAVVTMFVLDTFDRADLARVVGALAASLRPGGWWLYADFALPERGWRRLRARAWLGLLYGGFRLWTTMGARRLHDPAPLLAAAGVAQVDARTAQAGLLTSHLYRRRGGNPC